MRLALDADLAQPFDQFTAKVQQAMLFGSKEKGKRIDGIMDFLASKNDPDSPIAEDLAGFMVTRACTGCGGARLKPESLAIRVSNRTIAEVAASPITEALSFFAGLKLGERENLIAGRIIQEIRDRLEFLDNVGLSYLSLDRAANTLSGGESQRIRLATQIGSRLRGVLYVLDEPSIGLHHKDNARLLANT